MPKTSSAGAPLIKGYLPVRLKLSDDSNDQTFFYVKEHSGNERNTLFVANCPTVPSVVTKLLLKSIFGRYGEVTRVTVIPNPRQPLFVDNNIRLQHWTSNFAAPTYQRHYSPPQTTSHGKFAHVVFTSTKEMKRTFKALQQAMSSSTDETLPALTLDTIELQTLADETDRQLREQELGEGDDDGGDDTTERKTGILAVAARYRASCQRLSNREDLLRECNAVMQAYEDAEAAERRKRDEQALPDDDGFVTVSHSATSAAGSNSSSSSSKKRELEAAAAAAASDRRGRAAGAGPKRARKKKKGAGGAEPLPDFYRFQTREHRKRSLQDLRQRFEEDLTRVKKMKEERQYRPF